MKKIILLTTIILSTAIQAECVINAQVKKANAKTYFVDGASISKKVREALKSQCSFNVTTMTKAQLIEMAEKNHAKKIAKLKAGE
tara:strand:- start:310 stop:564 length:255 start_codon:yes stop_codon:yes gene_type:complete